MIYLSFDDGYDTFVLNALADIDVARHRAFNSEMGAITGAIAFVSARSDDGVSRGRAIWEAFKRWKVEVRI